MLSFCFNSITLYNIVVVMSSFETSLHFCELMLNSVQLNTSFFTGLPDFSDFFFFFSKLEVNTFVFVSKLFGESVLEPNHENLNRVN